MEECIHCGFVSFEALHSVIRACLCVSVCLSLSCSCVWLSTIAFTSLCDNVCAKVACTSEYLLIFLHSKLFSFFFYFREKASAYLCMCNYLCAFECVFEAELIFLHKSKQQVALTFSKQQARSYFGIVSQYAFTVWLHWGSMLNQKYPLSSVGTQQSTAGFVKRHTVERWGDKRQKERATFTVQDRDPLLQSCCLTIQTTNQTNICISLDFKLALVIGSSKLLTELHGTDNVHFISILEENVSLYVGMSWSDLQDQIWACFHWSGVSNFERGPKAVFIFIFLCQSTVCGRTQTRT